MKRLWHDIQTHRQASLWFLACWLVSTVVAIILFPDSPGMAVIVLAPPLVVGALVGRWRASERIGERINGAVLAGLLLGVILDLGMIAASVFSWRRTGPNKNEASQYLGEMVGFLVFFVVVGAVLGWVGARLAILLDRFRRPAAKAASLNLKNIPPVSAGDQAARQADRNQPR